MKSDIKTEVTKILTVTLDEGELEALVREYVWKNFPEFDGPVEIEWITPSEDHLNGVRVRTTRRTI